MKIFGLTIGTNKAAETAQPAEKSLGMGAGMAELFNRRSLVDYKSVSSALMNANEDWVYANVSAIAEEVSKMTLTLHRVRVVRGELVFDQILTHPILDLLDRFNPFTTASEAFFMTSSHIELAGDTFYLLDGAGANIKNIYLLQPDKITLQIGDTADNYAVVGYTYKDTIDGKTTEVTYTADQIIHIKEPDPANPYRGKSTVAAAALAIDTSNLAALWAKTFFRNSARPDLALTTEQNVSDENMSRLEAKIRNMFGGPRNAGKTMILAGGLKPAQLQMSNKDMEFIAIQEWTRDKIMAMFKNTKTTLGIVEDVNRANAEASILSWKQNVIKPKMQRIVDALNEFLVPRYGSNLILGFEDPVPENRSEKLEEVKTMVSEAKTPVLSINEARQILGYDPLKGEQFDLPPVSLGAVNLQALPKQVKNVNYVPVLRRAGILEQAENDTRLYSQARAVAKRIVRAKRKQQPKAEVSALRESRDFSNDVVWAYWKKQIQVSELIEKRFIAKVEGFLDNLVRKALSNLDEVSQPKGLKRKKTKVRFKQEAGALFNEEAEVQAAIDLLEPLLTEVATLSAEQAYDLINLDLSYVITNRLSQYVSRQTAQLAESFINTDIDKLSQIITQGIESGEGIPAIASRIRREFGEFTKVQANRIARTEVLRASNAGAIDAFQESGIVEAKQWLTAEDDRVDPICADLNGKIIGLRRRFFEDDYLSGLEPPIHPNCRCVVIPVLKDVKAMEIERLKTELAAKQTEIDQVKPS